MRVLVVEDDPMIGRAVVAGLHQQGYAVDWVRDGAEAELALGHAVYDVALLDLGLPRRDGLEVLKGVRRAKNDLPILIITARDAVADRIAGLDSGADDYLVKPFDLDELLARLRALLRRSEGRVETVLKCWNVEIDPAATVVRKSGKQVVMTAKEYRVLKLLMERAGKYVTKSDIEYALYSAENAAESNTTEVAIYSLRKKLGSEFIKSIRGVGYMIEA